MSDVAQADRSAFPVVSHRNPVTQAGHTQIENVVMLRKDLSPLAKLVYGYLKHLAWRNHAEGVDPLQETLADDLGVSVDAAQKALRDLAKAPVTEGGGDDADRLVVSRRRGLGRTNIYILNDPGESLHSRNRESRYQETADLPIPTRARSSSSSKTKELRKNLPATVSPVPKLSKVDGRDIAFDVLAEQCAIRAPSPRLREVAIALNGRKGAPEEGIRAQFAVFVAGYAPDAREALVTGEHFEQALGEEIRFRCNLYRKKMPGAALTPTALAKWWTDLPVLPDPTRSDGRVTTREMIQETERLMKEGR